MTITRDPRSGEVLARGGDARALGILERSGFLPVVYVHDRFHRLSYGMDESTERDRASRAAASLAAAGYATDLDPALHTHVPATAPAVPLGQQVASLAERVGAAGHSEEVAGALTELTAHGNGILPAVEQLLQTTAVFWENLGERVDYHCAQRLRHLAGQIEGISTDLAGLRTTLADRHTPHPHRTTPHDQLTHPAPARTQEAPTASAEPLLPSVPAPASPSEPTLPTLPEPPVLPAAVEPVSRADEAGTDVEIYRRWSGTVCAESRTGAPDHLLALLDRLHFDRKSDPSGRVWHELPAELPGSEVKQRATRAGLLLTAARYRAGVPTELYDEATHTAVLADFQKTRAASSPIAPSAPVGTRQPLTR